MRSLFLVVAVLFAGACAKPAVTAAPTPVAAPLYVRLGGYDALAAVTDDFLARLVGDTAIAPFFGGLEEADVKRVRQLIVDQLCNATGGPCFYVGRDMKTSHELLDIDTRIWESSVNHLVATLSKFGVPSREQNELLAIVAPMKGDIVRKQ
jgi:hemoglobin